MAVSQRARAVSCSPAPCSSAPAAVSQRPSGRVAGPAALRWPCRGLPMAVSWPGRPAVSRYSLASYPSASVTLLQSVLQPNSHPSQAQAITIPSLYRNTRSLPTQLASLSRYSPAIKPFSHDTILYRDTAFPSLQYTSNLTIQILPIAIYSAQLPACNTIVILQYHLATTLSIAI